LKENIAWLAKQEQQMSMVLDWPVPLKDLNISIAQLQRLVAQGGKFKQYKYCFSIILMTFKRWTDIYFIPPWKSGFSVAILPTLWTLLLGRRGFPRWPIYSLECIFSNLFGGKDLTAEVMSHLWASSYL
jgi:hypothetical protein